MPGVLSRVPRMTVLPPEMITPIQDAAVAGGASLHDVEALWGDHKLTRERVSLAVFDEVRPDLGNWLRAPYRKTTLGIASSGMHDGLSERAHLEGAVYDAKRFVSDVEQGNRS